MCGLLDIPTLSEKYKNGGADCRCKNYENVQGGKLSGKNRNLASTLYIGSKASTKYFCLYEKQKEQATKKKHTGIPVYIFRRMQKGGEIMNTSSFEHIVRIQFNALMITVIKCTVKSRNRQFARRSKREVLFYELSDTKNLECVTEDKYSCDYISFEVLNFTIQISNEKLAVALYKLSSKERDVILLRYFQSMSDQEIAELYHVSRSAIYRRRSNGLKKLKTLLKERN